MNPFNDESIQSWIHSFIHPFNQWPTQFYFVPILHCILALSINRFIYQSANHFDQLVSNVQALKQHQIPSDSRNATIQSVKQQQSFSDQSLPIWIYSANPILFIAFKNSPREQLHGVWKLMPFYQSSSCLNALIFFKLFLL